MLVGNKAAWSLGLSAALQVWGQGGGTGSWPWLRPICLPEVEAVLSQVDPRSLDLLQVTEVVARSHQAKDCSPLRTGECRFSLSSLRTHIRERQEGW